MLLLVSEDLRPSCTAIFISWIFSPYRPQFLLWSAESSALLVSVELWPLWSAGDQRIVSSGYVEPRMVCSLRRLDQHKSMCHRFEIPPPLPCSCWRVTSAGTFWALWVRFPFGAAALGVAEPTQMAALDHLCAGWLECGVDRTELLEKLSSN